MAFFMLCLLDFTLHLYRFFWPEEEPSGTIGNGMVVNDHHSHSSPDDTANQNVAGEAGEAALRGAFARG